MPEDVDFVTLAVKVLGRYYLTVAEAVAIFKGIWNGRGAADLAALEPIIEKLGDTMDPDNARVFVADALRTLDR